MEASLPAPLLPLEGVRVVDITVVWAGSFCTMLLADLGAEVIRVESTRFFPSFTRGWEPWPSEHFLRTALPMYAGHRQPHPRPWNRYPIFNAHARNKRSVTVNLDRPQGREWFRRLASVSDAFVENNGPGAMEKLGLTYDELRAVRPDLVMLRMPAFGTTGPYSGYRALGVHVEGVIGHTMLRGYPDMDASANGPVFVADAAAGAQGAFAVLAALRHRRETGRGQLIELAQSENALSFLAQAFMSYTMNGRTLGTLGNRHPYALQGCYGCRGDDRWVVLTVASDRHWHGLCAALGDPPWTRQEHFADVTSRYQHHDEFDRHMAAWTRDLDHYEVMHLLQAHGVPAGPVLDQAGAYADPHMRARNFFEEAFQEDCGTHLYPGVPFQMSRTSCHIRRGPVRLGEDNDYVYREVLGLNRREYHRLRRAGHVGTAYDPR